MGADRWFPSNHQGFGGRRRAWHENRALGAELPALFNAAQSEAAAAFGNGDLYMEKFVERPRHIEFQILADQYGTVTSLGERECSIQRRHQKLLEESPSTQVTPALREEIGQVLCKTLSEIGYVNAGTIEFLMDEDRRLYFIEMNTRIQVEHPVTEMVTDVDLVKSQILLAAGERARERAARAGAQPWTCDRVPDQRRASREVHAVGGKDYNVSSRRAGLACALIRLHYAEGRFRHTTIR